MNLYIGTSGYSYKEWKGSFYPEDLTARKIARLLRPALQDGCNKDLYNYFKTLLELAV